MNKKELINNTKITMLFNLTFSILENIVLATVDINLLANFLHQYYY